MALKNPIKKTGIRINGEKIDTSLLAYWHKQLGMPKTFEVFKDAEVLTDTLVHYYNKDMRYLNYANSLCVIYKNERETNVYANSGFWIFRPLDIPDYQLSVVKLTSGPIRFYENGSIFDARSMLFEGFWAYEKVADMVPRDYIPLAERMTPPN